MKQQAVKVVEEHKHKNQTTTQSQDPKNCSKHRKNRTTDSMEPNQRSTECTGTNQLQKNQKQTTAGLQDLKNRRKHKTQPKN